MNSFLTVVTTIFFGSSGWLIISEVLLIAGLWPLFRKSGIKPWWSLVPFVRRYMLCRCAGCEKEGRVLLVLSVGATILNLLGERLSILTFSVPTLALSIALTIILFVYEIRISKGLVDTYGRSRWWIPLWIFLIGPTAMIWGYSPKFMPKEQAHEHEIDDRIKEEELHGNHTWFRDFWDNSKRLLGYFTFRFDWVNVVLAVLITTIVASIARLDFFTTMDGTIKGSLALTCIAVWNGCFNSIKVVCRERKKLHEMKDDGMYMSSYIISVIIYQALLCLVQTGLSMYTCTVIGIKFPHEGLIINSLLFEIGITMFLISFAADLLCLCISATVKEISTAMTIMPFILVIQLVFSGSVINISAWSNSISKLTISNYGVKCIASQADYNNRPMVLGWELLQSIRDNDVGKTYKVGELMDLLQAEDSYPGIKRIREMDIGGVYTVGQIRAKIESSKTLNDLLDKDLGLDMTVGEMIESLTESNIIPSTEKLKEHTFGKVFTVKEIYDMINNVDAFKAVKEKKILFNIFSVGDALDAAVAILGDIKINAQFKLGDMLDTVMESSIVKDLLEKTPFEGLTVRKILEKAKVYETLDSYNDTELDLRVNVGKLIDTLLSMDEIKKYRDKELNLTYNIGALIDLVGTERVRDFVLEKTTEAVKVPEYEHTRENIIKYWNNLLLFILIFGVAFIAIMEVGMHGFRFGKKKEEIKKEPQ